METQTGKVCLTWRRRTKRITNFPGFSHTVQPSPAPASQVDVSASTPSTSDPMGSGAQGPPVSVLRTQALCTSPCTWHPSTLSAGPFLPNVEHALLPAKPSSPSPSSPVSSVLSPSLPPLPLPSPLSLALPPSPLLQPPGPSCSYSCCFLGPPPTSQYPNLGRRTSCIFLISCAFDTVTSALCSVLRASLPHPPQEAPLQQGPPPAALLPSSKL